MNYKELEEKSIADRAKQLCWDSITLEQQEEFTKQAIINWEKYLQELAVKCASDAEKYCRYNDSFEIKINKKNKKKDKK